MWWQEAVIYQIYPRSFADGDGDGVGDLAGLRAHLDHLGGSASTGSGCRRSTAPRWPTSATTSRPLRRRPGVRHPRRTPTTWSRTPTTRGLRVLLDCVPNHTSIEHPWFRDHPDCYVWRDGRGPDGAEPPNNWTRAFPFPPAQPAWTRDDATGRWYLHLFLPEQPDLDWENPDVVEAHARRAALLARPGRRRLPLRRHPLHRQGPRPARRPGRARRHPPLRAPRRPPGPPPAGGHPAVLDGYAGQRVGVGEVVSISADRVTERTAAYAGPDLLHLAFDFSAAAPSVGRRRHAGCGASPASQAAFDDDGGRWPTWAFGNHDNPRLRSRWGGSEAVARAAAVLQLGLRGTPFLYAGDELGLLDADRAGRPGRRPRRARRLPGADPVDVGDGPRVAGRAVAPVPARGRRAIRGGPARRPGRRSSGSTSGCSPPARRRRPCAPGRPPAGRRRRGRAGVGAARPATTAGGVLVSMADDVVAVEPGWRVGGGIGPRRHAGGHLAIGLPPGAAVWLRPG